MPMKQEVDPDSRLLNVRRRHQKHDKIFSFGVDAPPACDNIFSDERNFPLAPPSNLLKGAPMAEQLSRRERQIMDILFSRGQATATEITGRLPDPPVQAAVRTMLRILEDRGHVRHHKRGKEFVYEPTVPRQRAAGQALQRVLNVFFDGSFEAAVAAHLAEHAGRMTPEQLKRLSALIRQAKGKRGLP